MAGKPDKSYKARRRSDRDDEDNDDRNYTARWWRAEDGDSCASMVWSWIDRLRPQLVADNFDDLVHEAIYEGRPLASIGEVRGIEHLRGRRSSPANLNITRSMVDTATARLTKRRSMPVISADDAGWSEKLFAKRVSRILRRKMGGSSIERMSPNIIRDMVIRGDGVAKVVRFGGDVQIERIPVFELVYDPREAYYADPRTLAHHRPIAREVLCEEFPEYEEAIELASTFKRADQWTMHAYQGATYADHIEVAEAWHLPSGPDADDGQHVIAIRGKTVLREPWLRSRFPIVRCHWSAPLRGFRGHGLVEDLTGIQAKVNDICRDIQEALYFGSSLKVFQARTSGVDKHHLRSRHPVVIEYDGAPPQFVAPNPVSQQAIQFLELLIQKAYEISGISQMSASSKNTLGSNASGKAIDTMDDIQSDRFAHVEASYMQFRVDLGAIQIDEARALYMEAHGKVEQRFPEQGDSIAKKDLAPWIAEADWSKVDIDSGDYHLTLEPINFLPDSRAGKLSTVAELSKAGLIPDPTMTADLFDEPDLARANRSVLGPKHNIDRMLEDLADEDVPMIDCLPGIYTNLDLFVLMAKGEMEDAAAMRAPDEVLSRYDEAIKYAKTLQDQASASPSLAGMQENSMGASPNASTLGAPPAMGPPGMPPGPVPPGVMQ